MKIGDFGLAKAFGSPNRIYTHQVVTRWYRSPELLFGARMYGTAVGTFCHLVPPQLPYSNHFLVSISITDQWAMGCVIAELLLRQPFFVGSSDMEQLLKIFQVMGNATETNWPGVTSLPDFVAYKDCESIPFENIFTAVKDDMIQLLKAMIVLNPANRCTCSQALQMPYFSNDPAPTPPQLLPQPNGGNQETSDTTTERSSLKRTNFDSLDKHAPTAKRLNFDD